VHHAVGNGIRTDTERPPFFRNGLSEAHDSRLCSGIVCLANIPMQTGCRRHINYRTILRCVALRTQHCMRTTG
jgi:hypothetical protein